MPTRASNKRPRDLNQLAIFVVEDLTGEKLTDRTEEPEATAPAKNPHAQALAELGASKGGRARAEKLTPEQRSEIAKRAAAKRWAKQLGH